MNFDEKDKELLRELQKDCKQSIHRLGKKLGLSQTATHYRIKKLEKNKVITGYSAIVDPAKVNLNSTAFMYFNLKQVPNAKGEFPLTYIAKELAKYDKVSEVYSLAGDFDLFVKVHGANEKEIGEWQREMMLEIKDMTKVLDRVNTTLAYYTGKDSPILKID